MVLVLCISSDDALYLYKVSLNYLKGFLRVIQRTRFPIFKFSKGNNSVQKCRWSYGTCSLLIV